MKIILTIALQLMMFAVFAQSQVTILNQYFKEARSGSYATAPQSLFDAENDFNALLSELENYQSDSTQRIRLKAYDLSRRFGQIAKDQSAKQLAIDQQIKALQDEDRAIVGRAIGALSQFNYSTFTEADKNQILGLFNPEVPHFNEYVKLMGFLQLKEAENQLIGLIALKKSPITKWNIRLALARMNNEVAVNYISNKLENAPINDAFVYDIVPGLVYTKQAQVFEFLETQIQSNAANCSVANPDSNQKISCAYRIMEAIAPAIKNFPIATDEFGELMVDDHKQALQDLRIWLEENETYALNKEIY